MAINITWKSLTLTDPLSGATILDSLQGSFSSGAFVSIMGPSGAGKSSLLSILTCRLRTDNSKLAISGNVLLNGESYSLAEFSRLAAYVQQEDVFFGGLTVKETFAFQARLKLWSLSKEEQERRCHQILKKLNLMECAEALVGNSQFKKSISGGQKKRVAIGVELLCNPRILVFDEPTSGLDSHNALNITRLLGRLARLEQKLIMATIHQPSTLIFRQMDKLYLLRAGKRIFSGDAAAIVPYMESINIQINYRMNPADFFMLEISKLKEQSGYNTPLNSENFHRLFGSISLENKSLCIHSKSYILHERNEGEEAPFWHQFRPLVDRGFKNFIRTPSNQINKPLTGLLVPIFLGIMYMDIGKVPEQFDQSYLFDLFSYLFMTQYIVMAMNIYDTCLIFPTEKDVVCKQAGGNLYSFVAYFMAKLATELPACLISAATNATIAYFMVGLDPTLSHFAVFLGILLMLSMTGFLFGLMFGVLNKNPEQAITLMPLVVIPLILFGGLVVNIHDIPVYVRWISYLTPLRHSFIIVFQDQLQTTNMAIYSGLDLPTKYGLDGDPWIAFACLTALMLTYLLAALLLLIYLKKRI